jgi:hypothetical protein
MKGFRHRSVGKRATSEGNEQVGLRSRLATAAFEVVFQHGTSRVMKRDYPAFLALTFPDHEPIRGDVGQMQGPSLGGAHPGCGEQAKQGAVGVGTQRASGTQLTSSGDKALDFLLMKDVGSGSLAPSTEAIVGWEFMASVFRVHKADKTTQRH